MTGKESKETANYGPGRMSGAHCAICKHFEPPKACAIVAGIISPHGWCRHFVGKAKDHG